MFTGIIETVGEIISIECLGGDMRFRIKTGIDIQASLNTGDSIAVNGVCLTVIRKDTEMIDVDVSNESLSCTALGDYVAGSRVNLERALALSERLDGHLVSGHVDGTASVVQIDDDGRSKRMIFESQDTIVRYIVKKGSVSIDGTSLTVNTVENNQFSINVIPHTLNHTIMSDYRIGTSVNVEVDIIARYIEKLIPGNV